MPTRHLLVFVLAIWAALLVPSLAASRSITNSDCDCEPIVQRPSLSELVKRVKPAVATVHVYNDDGDVVSQGSGWFLTERVVVATRHTFWKDDLLGAAYAKITTNSPIAQQYLVKSVLVDDRSYDLVLLEVLPVVPRGVDDPDSEQSVLEVNVDLPEEGEEVFVISSPLGLPGVISPGIVSAMHNDFDLQISSPVSTGSSGAPILDYSGKVVGIVTGHLSTGQNLNFGLTVKALAAVIAKLRPILHERPLILGLPAPLRFPPSSSSSNTFTKNNNRIPSNPKIHSGTKIHNPENESQQQQVIVYDQKTAAEGEVPTQPVPNREHPNFDKEIKEVEREREREWCYPTLSEWVNSQNARRQEQGVKKWWKGWRRFLAGLFSSNATEDEPDLGVEGEPPQSALALEALPAGPNDADTGTTIVDYVQSPPQSPAPPSPSTTTSPSASKLNFTGRGYSPEILLEDIASLRLCTMRRPSDFVEPPTSQDDEDASEDLDKL